MGATRKAFMKTTYSIAIALAPFFGAVACSNAPPLDGAPAAPPAASSTDALEQALTDVDTGRDPARTRAALEATIADGATSRGDRARADVALARLMESTDKERAALLLEDAVTLGDEDAQRRLFTLLAGHEPPSRWRQRDDTPVAASAIAFAKYYPPATPDAKVEIDIVRLGPDTTQAQAALGTFSIGAALRQNAIDACGLCDLVKTNVHTHESHEGLWSAIPTFTARLERALVVLYVDEETLVPERYAHWMAASLGDVRAAFARGDGLVAVKERPGAPPLVTIAAPRVSQLATVEASLAGMKELPKEPAAVKLESGLSKEEVRSAVQARFHAFKGCYESLLERRPKAGGHAHIAYTITSTGSVTDATVSLDPLLEDPEHRACFEKVIASLRYPAWSKDPKAKTTVRYPIRFSPTPLDSSGPRWGGVER
jgi:hypothetical protein